MTALRIRAVIMDGPADESTLEIVRSALAAPGLAVLFAKPTVRDVIERVSHEMGVCRDEIHATRSSKRGGRARNAISWLAYRITGQSSAVIGRAIGITGRNVLMAIERAEALRQRDPAFGALTDRLHEHFTGEKP